MQLQELVKNALIDANLADYAVDMISAEDLRQGEILARQSVNALNNDPAIAFGLETLELENVTDIDIYFPLQDFILTEEGGKVLMEEQGYGQR